MKKRWRLKRRLPQPPERLAHRGAELDPVQRQERAGQAAFVARPVGAVRLVRVEDSTVAESAGVTADVMAVSAQQVVRVPA